MSRVLRDGDETGDEVDFFCLHVLPEVEVEVVVFEFEFEGDDVVDDEVGLEVDGVDELEEVDEELVPDKSARTGKGAVGAGVGKET